MQYDAAFGKIYFILNRSLKQRHFVGYRNIWPENIYRFFKEQNLSFSFIK